MLIDLAEENARRNEPVIAFNEAGKAEISELERQMKLLDETCPRYDVHNVYTVLFPKLIQSEFPPAKKRNEDLLAKRDTLRRVAMKAPLGRPWDTFYLECRLNEQQRGGVLVRWDAENRQFLCTMMFDSLRNPGMIILANNAFRIHLNDDDMFTGHVVQPQPSVNSDEFARKLAELVRTSIELLNWDREVVPTAVRTQGKKAELNEKKTAGSSQKSDPTIIKFESFLKGSLPGVQLATGGAHSAPSLHLVRGHYKNFKHDAPLFGHKPVLGKTYGRLWVRPHQSGSPAGGDPKTPTAVIRIGELACAG